MYSNRQYLVCSHLWGKMVSTYQIFNSVLTRQFEITACGNSLLAQTYNEFSSTYKVCTFHTGFKHFFFLRFSSVSPTAGIRLQNRHQKLFFVWHFNRYHFTVTFKRFCVQVFLQTLESSSLILLLVVIWISFNLGQLRHCIKAFAPLRSTFIDIKSHPARDFLPQSEWKFTITKSRRSKESFSILNSKLIQNNSRFSSKECYFQHLLKSTNSTTWCNIPCVAVHLRL